MRIHFDCAADDLWARCVCILRATITYYLSFGFTSVEYSCFFLRVAFAMAK